MHLPIHNLGWPHTSASVYDHHSSAVTWRLKACMLSRTATSATKLLNILHIEIIVIWAFQRQ